MNENIRGWPAVGCADSDGASSGRRTSSESASAIGSTDDGDDVSGRLGFGDVG